MSLTAALLDFAITVIHSIGYIGVSILLFVANIGIPIPSEAVLILSGVAVHAGSFGLVAVAIIALVMQMFGLIVAYAVGKYGGEPLITRYGKYVLISDAEYRKTKQWFAKNGSKAIVISLLIPVVRAFIGIVAGANSVRFRTYVVQCVLGSSVWTALWLGVGWLLGDSWRRYYAYLHYLDYIVITVLVLLIARFVWRKKMGSDVRSRGTQSPTSRTGRRARTL